MPGYQLKVSNLYNFPISNVKDLVPKFFYKEKYVLYYENLQLYVRNKTKKIHRALAFNQSQGLKLYTQKITEAEKW